MSTLADEELANRIVKRISDEKILGLDQKKLEKLILSGNMKSEDWQLLIENVLLENEGKENAETN